MSSNIPIPFIGPPNQRGTGTGDRRFINCLFELVVDEAQKQQIVYCPKRPGLSNSTQPPAGAATGRGLYAWGETGKIYSVFANKIYSGTTDLGMTLAASTGRVWWAERPVSTGTQHLIMSDGADNYNITTGDVATQIDTTDDADYPDSNLGSICYLDGFLFQARSNGRIYNSDLNSATSWTSTGFLTADTHGGDLEAILLMKDQILALTKNRVEFFFNNGNPTGSPLLRIDQNTLQFGLAHKNSLAWSGETAIFVTENGAESHGRSVMMLGSLKVREISTPAINRFLAAEGTTISTCTAWMGQVAGQLIYVLNLDAAERTFVYSVDTGMWQEWEIAAGGAKFNGIASTSLDGTTYVQDATNGRIYTLSPTVFQDSGSNFTWTAQTSRSNFGSAHRKSNPSLSLLADTTSGTMTVEVSDNDYSSFSTVGTIDMAQEVKRLYRLGSFYNRAYRFTHAANAALRLQAYIPEIVEHSR